MASLNPLLHGDDELFVYAVVKLNICGWNSVLQDIDWRPNIQQTPAVHLFMWEKN